MSPDGLKTERIVVDISFEEDIPEWLPILGKKARVYYAGIKRQCHKCYKLDHNAWECKNTKINWKQYCDNLFESGRFERELFGHWISAVKGSKPQQEKQDLRNFLSDPDSLKEMVGFLKAIQQYEKEDKVKRRAKNKPSQAQAPGKEKKTK